MRETVATNAVTGLLCDGTLLVTLAAQHALPEMTGAPLDAGPVAQVTARLALTPGAATELVNMLNGLLSAIPSVRFEPAGRPAPQQ